MSSPHLYLYGVIESADLRFETDAVGGATEVRTVSHGPLSGVVSDIETTEPERNDEDVEAHDEVLRELLTRDEELTVVPMRYGMAFKNARTLKNLLRQARPVLTRSLREVEGSVELGLKVLDAEDGDLDPEAVRSAAERFDEVSEKYDDGDLFSDRLVLNRSYLVDRADTDAFDEAVESFREEFGDDVIVQYSGPWAPYSFVDVHIGVEQ
ncbi:GvpL/GvpF family gas vesicle protein [Halorarum halophilum]|uniref:GvpL/GvpF family gas vesicle protein n=1 Tax=Halorarum halophilum TaxID=2743090 RepID=A0A7D5K259_9EURY|nr:GvpL/GvpF family gas vesicle protein [Halobaculum halophilum]QLG28561.1 GvpL/GvpF family gas vesicle protein [Halobaculum halophilum]